LGGYSRRIWISRPVWLHRRQCLKKPNKQAKKIMENVVDVYMHLSGKLSKKKNNK
jgi:hypothetical protein